MSSRQVACIWSLALGLGFVALVRADPVAAPAQAGVATSVPQSARRCGHNHEKVTVLRMTAIEQGLPVEHAFVRPGPGTWTNANRPLLKQLGIRPGSTLCLPRIQAEA
jgi:hypothetical protein